MQVRNKWEEFLVGGETRVNVVDRLSRERTSGSGSHLVQLQPVTVVEGQRAAETMTQLTGLHELKQGLK